MSVYTTLKMYDRSENESKQEYSTTNRWLSALSIQFHPSVENESVSLYVFLELPDTEPLVPEHLLDLSHSPFASVKHTCA